MPKTSPFEIVFDELVPEHLDAIQGKSISLIRTTIEEQLRLEPHVETRNRKPLGETTTFGATWSPLWTKQPLSCLLRYSSHEKASCRPGDWHQDSE